MSYSRANQNRDRGYAGLGKLRKTLRRMEPEINGGVKATIEKGAEAIETDIVINGQSHRITGDMIEAISTKMGRDGMTAVIGPGAKWVSISKSPLNTALVSARNAWGAFQFFKAYWIEFGTKGSPERNIPPQPAKPFVQPAWDANKGWLIREARAAVSNAIRRASSE